MKKYKKIQALLLNEYLPKIADYSDLEEFVYIGKAKFSKVNRYFFIANYENKTKFVTKLIKVSHWKHSEQRYHYFVDTTKIDGYSDFIANIDDKIKQVDWYFGLR